MIRRDGLEHIFRVEVDGLPDGIREGGSCTRTRTRFK
jgi:hypothetical protein